MTHWVQNQQTEQSPLTRSFFGVPTFTTAALIGIVMMGFLYLTQVNALAVHGYVLRDVEDRLATAQASNRSLELQAQAHHSTDRLSTVATTLGMVKVDTVEYVRPSVGTVAIAR